MPSLTTPIQHSIGSPSHSDQTRKRNKRHPNWKEEMKLSPFADDMIVYTEYPIDSTKNQHDLISEFGKQQLQSQYSEIKGIFYTNNKILEAEIMKKSHLI